MYSLLIDGSKRNLVCYYKGRRQKRNEWLKIKEDRDYSYLIFIVGLTVLTALVTLTVQSVIPLIIMSVIAIILFISFLRSKGSVETKSVEFEIDWGFFDEDSVIYSTGHKYHKSIVFLVDKENKKILVLSGIDLPNIYKEEGFYLCKYSAMRKMDDGDTLFAKPNISIRPAEEIDQGRYKILSSGGQGSVIMDCAKSIFNAAMR